MNLKNFDYEDGNFYCKDEKDGDIHTVGIIIKTTTFYDIENDKLQKPEILRVEPEKILLSCDCGNNENITDIFQVVKEEGYYGGHYIKEKES